MRTFSTLCRVCDGMLSVPLIENSPFFSHMHHETLESFQNAISQGCYICSTVWQGIVEEQRSRWLKNCASWKPLHYYAERDIYQDLKLHILVSSRNTIELKTYLLFPPGSKYYIRMFPNTRLEASTGSSQTLGTIKNWYLSCHAAHGYCRNFVQSRPWCPTRLLDIGTEGDTEWNLCIVSAKDSPPPKYMTLSYRWGSNLDFQLTDSKLKSGFRGNIIDLPATFRDAICVARLLSVRYLWIDRLCIIQDSQKDWEKESMTMRDVYANSLCNIAASASNDPEGGLFRNRNFTRIEPGFVKADFGNNEEQCYHMVDQGYYDRQIFDGPLQRRGWVFQERILAPRTVHFAEDQVFWECSEELKCEVIPSEGSLCITMNYFGWQLKDLELNKPLSEEYSDEVFDLWHLLVMGYTQCSLARESDRLVAFSGIAQLVQSLTGDEYLAGLWRSRLEEYLSWRALMPVPRSTSKCGAPSWSWASLSSPVRIEGSYSHSPIPITVLDVKMRSQLPHTGSSSLFDYIKLTGYVFPATYKFDAYWGFTLEVEKHPLTGRASPDALDTELEDGKAVYCLIMRTFPTTDPKKYPNRNDDTMSLMVLERSTTVSNVYKRFGWFEVNESGWEKDLGISPTTDGLITTKEHPRLSEIILI